MMIKVTTLKPTDNAMIRCCLFNPALLFLLWSVCGVGDDDDIPHSFPWSRMIRYAKRGRSKGDGHLPFEEERKKRKGEEEKKRKGFNDGQSQAVDLAGFELSDSFTFQQHSHWSDDQVTRT
jgi:hypothetical protein